MVSIWRRHVVTPAVVHAVSGSPPRVRLTRYETPALQDGAVQASTTDAPAWRARTRMDESTGVRIVFSPSSRSTTLAGLDAGRAATMTSRGRIAPTRKTAMALLLPIPGPGAGATTR